MLALTVHIKECKTKMEMDELHLLFKENVIDLGTSNLFQYLLVNCYYKSVSMFRRPNFGCTMHIYEMSFISEAGNANLYIDNLQSITLSNSRGFNQVITNFQMF